MKKITCLAASAAAFLLTPGPALAHPGHALMEPDLTHWVTSPDHAAVLALTGTALILAGTLVRRRWPRAALRISGVCAMVGAAAAWSLSA